MKCSTNGKPKKRYTDKRTVRIVRSQIKQRTGIRMEIYFCRYCNGYHLGNRPLWMYLAQQRRYEEVLVGKLIGALKLVLNKDNTNLNAKENE